MNMKEFGETKDMLAVLKDGKRNATSSSEALYDISNVAIDYSCYNQCCLPLKKRKFLFVDEKSRDSCQQEETNCIPINHIKSEEDEETEFHLYQSQNQAATNSEAIQFQSYTPKTEAHKNEKTLIINPYQLYPELSPPLTDEEDNKPQCSKASIQIRSHDNPTPIQVTANKLKDEYKAAQHSTEDHKNIISHELKKPSVIQAHIREKPSVIQAHIREEQYQHQAPIQLQLNEEQPVDMTSDKLVREKGVKEKKQTMSIFDRDFFAGECDELIIGPNKTRVPKKYLKELHTKMTASTITRKILMAVFDRETLGTSSLSGNLSPAFSDRVAKKQLDPFKVEDVISFVRENTKASKRDIKCAITSKCADEGKRMQRSRNLIKAKNDEDK